MAKNGNEVKEKKVSYFKAMKTELKKVTWPTPKELVNNTVAVISFVLIITLIVFILDSGFNAINQYGVTKLQEKIQSSFKNVENTDESNSEVSDSDTSDINVTTDDAVNEVPELENSETENTDEAE